MSITKEQVLDYIGGLTVLELADLVKAFEEKFGVSATPVVAAGAVAAPTEAVEEKTEFTVTLLDSGEKKINVIKVLRELTGLGLKEAKDAAEKTPTVLKEAANKAESEEFKKKLEDVGAKVEVK